jgi:hypothetical protein
MMRFSQVTVALFLCLLLGLSTSVSVVHNYSYHDNHLAHDEHDEHDKANCAYTVVQYSASLLAHEIPAVSVPVFGSKNLTPNISSQFRQPDNGFFARAPPTSV